MPSNLTRRVFIASAAAATLPLPALALSEAQAKALVDKLVAQINKVIASGKSEGAMIRDFEKIFVRYADTNIMARYALGADARSASAGQMKKFTRAFQGYISRKYGKRFREFIGGRVDVTGSRKIKSGYEIKSVVTLRGQSPFEVIFLVSDKSGKPLFFNMFIEGINLLLTERSEIGSLLDKRKGNLDQLTADLGATG